MTVRKFVALILFISLLIVTQPTFGTVLRCVRDCDEVGNRVAKTSGGVTTSYLVDTNSITGYAQVVEEQQSGVVVRRYAYGLQLISKLETGNGKLSFYGYDGHGSVRQLTDFTGAITDTYDYDAFGNLLTKTGSSANNYLFAGEQYDSDLGLYYNRARYLDTRQGRFWGVDTTNPTGFDPSQLHQYLYCSSFALDCLDPSGHDADIASTLEATTDEESIGAQQANQATRVGNAARKIVNALKCARDIGKSAEQAIEDALDIEKNTQRIQSITRSVKFRVPDFLEDDYLIEVKNVAYQYLSQQIIDLAYYASANGLTFYLAIRYNTELSQELQALVDSGVIKLIGIP